MGIKRTRQEVEEIVSELGYELLDKYLDKKITIVIIQNSNGYKWMGQLNTLINNDGRVRFFNVGSPFILENISLWLSLNNPELELCEGSTYEGSTKRGLVLFHNIPECQEKIRMNWSNVSQGKGCPICAGKQIGVRNSLAHVRPDLILEWSPKNIISPYDVTVSSDYRALWSCLKCNYEWITKVEKRTSGQNCPACMGHVVSDSNRLSIIFPDIAKEWDYEKNNDTPDDVSFGSNKKRWWICSEGHSYSSSVNNRKNGVGCKKCSDERQESIVAYELKEYFKQNYNSESEYPICINPSTGQYLPYDIYLFGGENLEINGVYIEVQGDQHFVFVPFWHKKEENFERRKELDRIKKQFAKKYGTYIEIDLRKIKTTEDAIEYIENILSQL